MKAKKMNQDKIVEHEDVMTVRYGARN